MYQLVFLFQELGCVIKNIVTGRACIRAKPVGLQLLLYGYDCVHITRETKNSNRMLSNCCCTEYIELLTIADCCQWNAFDGRMRKHNPKRW